MTKAIRKCFPESCCVLCNIHIEENYEKIPPPMDLEGLKYHTMTMEEHVPEFAKYCKTEEVNLGTQKKQSCFLEVDKQCLRVHVLYFEAVN